MTYATILQAVLKEALGWMPEYRAFRLRTWYAAHSDAIVVEDERWGDLAEIESAAMFEMRSAIRQIESRVLPELDLISAWQGTRSPILWS